MASMSHIYRPDDELVGRPDATPQPHRYIHRGGDTDKAIDVAILAEGYTAEQTDSFYTHAAQAVEAILAHEPFRSMPERFNFVAVASPSADEGVSVPRLSDWRSTAFSSHFSTFYSDRYLTTSALPAVHDALRGIPYEHIIILANTPEYGGGGIYNSYTLTAARHPLMRPVVVHEFGHSFGGLADEYFYEQDVMSDTYPLDVEPWEPNITTLVDFPSKWQALIPDSVPQPTPVADANRYPIGLYEGGGYSFKGCIVRPTNAECAPTPTPRSAPHAPTPCAASSYSTPSPDRPLRLCHNHTFRTLPSIRHRALSERFSDPKIFFDGRHNPRLRRHPDMAADRKRQHACRQPPRPAHIPVAAADVAVCFLIVKQRRIIDHRLYAPVGQKRPQTVAQRGVDPERVLVIDMSHSTSHRALHAYHALQSRIVTLRSGYPRLDPIMKMTELHAQHSRLQSVKT